MKFEYIQQFLFFGLLVITSGFFIWMIGSYLWPVFWAIVIAVLFYPLYERVERTLPKWPSVAALITIFSIVLLVVTPLLLIGGMVVQESIVLYKDIVEDSGEFNSSSMLARLGEFTAYLEPFGVSSEMVEDRLKGWASALSKQITSSAVTLGQITFSFVVYTGVMLYLLFFFLRDGAKLQQLLIHYLPLGDAIEKQLFARFSQTSRAVVKGTLVVALLQGLIGGVTFWALGISNPLLWGVVMTLLSVVPVVGPALVWGPAALLLIVTGSMWSGVILIIVGVLLVGLVDEFLRPILVGRGTQMPDSIVLLATVGGLTTFGIAGFVVGPIIAAFFLSLWTIYEERYKTELSNN